MPEDHSRHRRPRSIFEEPESEDARTERAETENSPREEPETEDSRTAQPEPENRRTAQPEPENSPGEESASEPRRPERAEVEDIRPGGGNETHKYLHAYNLMPSVRFESQLSDEKAYILVRKHPITFVPWIITSIVLSLIPLFANVVLVQILNIPQIIFINFFWYSMVFSYVFVNILVWLFNVGIITNRRIIDIDYTTIINKEFTGTSLEDVTDATGRTSGFIRSLYNYGDVFVQTAGSAQNIDFHAVPNPSNVVSVINRLMK